MTLRIVSYGGGVQSTALLVLAARGEVNSRTFLFANVGDDSENPASLVYVREAAMPYALKYGIHLEELRRYKRDGTLETLYGRMTEGSTRSIGIPVRMSPSGAPGRRACTKDFKVLVINKWLKAHGATKDDPAVVHLGISLDESQRMRTDSGLATQVLDYPLVRMRLTRHDCVRLIEDAGLPVPPKSSCYFCPYHSVAGWQKLRQEEPILFAKSVALEKMLSERHIALGRGAIHMSSRGKPLMEATTDHTQGELFVELEADTCESGYCHG